MLFHLVKLHAIHYTRVTCYLLHANYMLFTTRNIDSTLAYTLPYLISLPLNDKSYVCMTTD